MEDLPKPTHQQILKLAGALEDTWRATHDEIRHRKALRLRTAPVMWGQNAIPEEYKRTTVEIRTAAIQYNVQEAQALLLSNRPVVTARPPSRDKQEVATTVERWCNAAISRLEEITGVDRKVSDCQVAYWAGVRKFYPLRKPYPDFPAQDEKESDEDWDKRTEEWKKAQPLTSVFHYSYIPPETFFPAKRDSRGIPAAMEIKRVPEWDLMKEFGLVRGRGDQEYIYSEAGADPDQYDPIRTVEVIEYWNRQWRAFVIKGKDGPMLGEPWEHNFGRIPYFVSPPYETGETEPEHQYIPLLWALYPEAEENNRLHTMRTNVAYFTGFPFYYVKTIATGDLVLDEKTGNPKVFVLSPGKMPQLKPGQEIVPVNLISGFDLQAALQDSDDKMQQYALPPIASGRAPSSESPAWGTRMLHRFLVTLLDPLVAGRASALTEMLRFALWSVKHQVGQKVYVNPELTKKQLDAKDAEPIALGPDDIEDYDISVRIDPELEMDRTQQEAHGLQLVQAGARSMMTFLEEDCGRDAPEEEMKRIDEDQFVAAMKPHMLQVALQWIQSYGAIEQVLMGASPEEVMRGMDQTQGALGKGSPEQPREPGLRMPAEGVPVGESSTFTPPVM